MEKYYMGMEIEVIYLDVDDVVRTSYAMGDGFDDGFQDPNLQNFGK